MLLSSVTYIYSWSLGPAASPIVSCLLALMLRVMQLNAWMQIEGSQPEWCISSKIYSRDTPFWSGTLEIESEVMCASTVGTVFLFLSMLSAT